MFLNTPITQLVGVGYSIEKALERLNIFTIEDLINHYPFRYEDYSQTTNALEAQIGQKVTLVGEIWSIKNIFTRSRKIITQAIFNDGTSPITLTWFNSSWLTKKLATGDRVQISGKLNKYKNKLSIVAPVWEKISINNEQLTVNNSLHTGRLVPVYPETYGLSSKWFRTKINLILPKVLGQIEDPLPEDLKKNMLPLQQALKQIHFPDDWKSLTSAQQRLSFDELFFIQLAAQKTKLSWQQKKIIKPLKINKNKLNVFLKSLPFFLTRAQKKVLGEIISDLTTDHPMNRLVQGEVGSGKTVVAAATAYLAYLNDLRSILMAPTEILAFQHYDTLSKLLSPFGVKVEIYTGSKKFNKINDKRLKIKEKKVHQSSIINHYLSPDVIVGTHALLSTKLTTDNIGLIVVDEQQRFGVKQRTLLRNKAYLPHFLTMTATPIPRTVALTLYGDLDLSIINELPKGRKKVLTFVVPSKKRQDAYKFIAKEIGEGGQVYIITPLIEPSETLQTAKAAKVEFERLQKDIFPDLKLGLLHGKLRPKEKELVINEFRDKKIDILVSTSVVEVGVDIPNATIMVIEGAERFGLAQLHQLRGRVGRGEKKSFCLLFAEVEKSGVTNRLKNMEKIYDGLKLSELDLKIRGSGEIFGTRQSGRWNLKIASFSDLSLLEKTRNAAKKILVVSPALDKYPKLKAKLSSLATEVMPD